MSNGKGNNQTDFRKSSFSRPNEEPPKNELNDGAAFLIIGVCLIQATITFMYAAGAFDAKMDDWDKIFATLSVVLGVGCSIVVNTMMRRA